MWNFVEIWSQIKTPHCINYNSFKKNIFKKLVFCKVNSSFCINLLFCMSNVGISPQGQDLSAVVIAIHWSAHRTSYGRSEWWSACAHEWCEKRTVEHGGHVLHEEKNLRFKYALKNLVRTRNDDKTSSSSRIIPVLWRMISVLWQHYFRC